HVLNLGQGAALQTGIEYCLLQNAPYICTFDADGQHAVESVDVLCDYLNRADADVAIGSRSLGHAVNIPFGKRLLLWPAVWFTRMHTGLPVTDTHNGLRLMTNAAAQKIRIRQVGMAHASEVLMQIGRHKLKYVEAPVVIEYTEYSMSKGQPVSNSLRILRNLLVAGWRR
ncbi:MAG: glycosyltransferase family 2 protein, partial [Bryobacteraceae bacterium]